MKSSQGKIYYMMECNCILTKEETIKRYRDGNYGGGLYISCPVHVAAVSERIRMCIDCGGAVIPPSGRCQIALRCKLCKRLNLNKLERNWSKNKRSERKTLSAKKKRIESYNKTATKKKFLFITKCGCTVENKEVAIKYCKSASGNKTKLLACPEHFESLKERITTCDECTEWFAFGMRGAVPTRCPDCRKIRNNKSCNESQKNRRRYKRNFFDNNESTNPTKARSEADALIKGIEFIPMPGLIKIHSSFFAQQGG